MMERSEANLRVAQKGGPEGILPSKEAKKGGAVKEDMFEGFNT